MSDTPGAKRLFKAPFSPAQEQPSVPSRSDEQPQYPQPEQGTPPRHIEQSPVSGPISGYGNSFHNGQRQTGDLSQGPRLTGNLPPPSLYPPRNTPPGGNYSLPHPPEQFSPPLQRPSTGNLRPQNPPSLWNGAVPQGGPPPAMRALMDQASAVNGPVGNRPANADMVASSPNHPRPAIPVLRPPTAPVQPQNRVAPGAQAKAQTLPLDTSKWRFYRRLPGYRKFSDLRSAAQYSLKARIILFALIVCILTPLFIGVGEGVNTVIIYSHANGGIQHLLKIRAMFTGSGGSHAQGLLDVNKLKLARQEMLAAHDDFVHLNDDLGQDLTVGLLSAFLPKQITSARALSKIGVDVTDMGQELISTAEVLAPTFRNPLANDPNNKQPLVTQAMLQRVDKSITYVLPRLASVEQQTRNLSLESFPLNDNQREQFKQIVDIIPLARTGLQTAHDLMGSIGWILGVDQPRRFLVQTMDRGELRATGGFNGQYGELDINAGRMGQFNLKDIGAAENFNPNNPSAGNLAPEPYRQWWPFANWGLRDANLSPDYPTSAKLAMGLYQAEFKGKIDGVIMFSPFMISRILQAIGPVEIKKFRDTVTAENLEERLHYYQLDNEGIRKIKILNGTPNAEDDAVRKLFTAEVARVLMDHVRKAPPDEMLSLAGAMLHALQTKDLQVYLNNQQAQDLLAKYKYSSQVDSYTKNDGYFVVQTNTNATKASQYTRTSLQDTVTLDAQGGATHFLQIRLAYNQAGPVYGMDTLRDYVRVYLPQNSRLLAGDGFEFDGYDTAGYYCGAGYGPCPSPDVYGNGALLCSAGIDNAGVTPKLLGDPYSQQNHPFRRIGAPPNTTSDLPGRMMVGGYVVVPKNCTATATLSWYVPPTGQGSYDLLVQRQVSTLPELNLTILPAPGACASYEKPGLYFDGVLGGADPLFSLKMKPGAVGNKNACYQQPPT